MFEKIKGYFRKKKELKEKNKKLSNGCVVQCVCGEFLQIKSLVEIFDDGSIKYCCNNCKEESRYHFDLCMNPLRMTLDGKEVHPSERD